MSNLAGLSGLTAPHGPNPAADEPVHTMSQNEKQIFDYLIKPDDIYNEQGIYWADLPLAQRIRFVSGGDSAEAKKELSSIGRMVKKDPLSPVGWYFRNAVIPGAGLGLEG